MLENAFWPSPGRTDQVPVTEQLTAHSVMLFSEGISTPHPPLALFPSPLSIMETPKDGSLMWVILWECVVPCPSSCTQAAPAFCGAAVQSWFGQRSA